MQISSAPDIHVFIFFTSSFFPLPSALSYSLSIPNPGAWIDATSSTTAEQKYARSNHSQPSHIWTSFNLV